MREYVCLKVTGACSSKHAWERALLVISFGWFRAAIDSDMLWMSHYGWFTWGYYSTIQSITMAADQVSNSDGSRAEGDDDAAHQELGRQPLGAVWIPWKKLIRLHDSWQDCEVFWLIVYQCLCAHCCMSYRMVTKMPTVAKSWHVETWSDLGCGHSKHFQARSPPVLVPSCKHLATFRVRALLVMLRYVPCPMTPCIYAGGGHIFSMFTWCTEV